MKKINPFLGYYEGAEQEPTVDPGLDIDCFVCIKPLKDKRRSTTSFVASTGGARSYFFRTHKECWDNLSESDRLMYEGSFVDNLEDVGGNWLPQLFYE